MKRVNLLADGSIFTVGGFFTADECEAYIRWSEDIGYTDAPITTPVGPVLHRGVRNNSRVMLDDHSRANDIWQRAADFVDDYDDNWRPIGLNERLRFYRYDIGQRFKWHADGHFERPNGERSWLTFMIYLNSDFDGGHTAFGKTVVEPETGMALFFDHKLPHTGQSVARGRKYVLRSDVMYRCDAR